MTRKYWNMLQAIINVGIIFSLLAPLPPCSQPASQQVKSVWKKQLMGSRAKKHTSQQLAVGCLVPPPPYSAPKKVFIWVFFLFLTPISYCQFYHILLHGLSLSLSNPHATTKNESFVHKFIWKAETEDNSHLLLLLLCVLHKAHFFWVKKKMLFN